MQQHQQQQQQQQQRMGMAGGMSPQMPMTQQPSAPAQTSQLDAPRGPFTQPQLHQLRAQIYAYKVLARNQPFAFFAKPCDVAALRNYAEQDPRVDALVKY